VRSVTLYGKPGCCLCDDARKVVLEVRESRPFALEEVDVTLDPGLERQYGERIPVVAVDGKELFEYHVDPDALAESVSRVET
jgi:glutaredoxin